MSRKKNISYSLNSHVTPEEVIDVFKRSGIRRPVDDLDRICKMTKNANLIACARMERKLVGIARALTDFSYCCYVSDLAVDRDYQKQGIGKKLIQQIQAELGEEVMISLIAAPEAEAYYPRIGFEKVNTAWRIPRVK